MISYRPAELVEPLPDTEFKVALLRTLKRHGLVLFFSGALYWAGDHLLRPDLELFSLMVAIVGLSAVQFLWAASRPLLGRMKYLYPNAKVEGVLGFDLMGTIPILYLACIWMLMKKKPDIQCYQTPFLLRGVVQRMMAVGLMVSQFALVTDALTSKSLNGLTYWIGLAPVHHLGSVLADVRDVARRGRELLRAEEPVTPESLLLTLRQERSITNMGYVMMNSLALSYYAKRAKAKALGVESLRSSMGETFMAILDAQERDRAPLIQVNPLNLFFPVPSVAVALVVLSEKYVALMMNGLLVSKIERIFNGAGGQAPDERELGKLSVLRDRLHASRSYRAIHAAKGSVLGPMLSSQQSGD